MTQHDIVTMVPLVGATDQNFTVTTLLNEVHMSSEASIDISTASSSSTGVYSEKEGGHAASGQTSPRSFPTEKDESTHLTTESWTSEPYDGFKSAATSTDMPEILSTEPPKTSSTETNKLNFSTKAVEIARFRLSWEIILVLVLLTMIIFGNLIHYCFFYYSQKRNSTRNLANSNQQGDPNDMQMRIFT